MEITNHVRRRLDNPIDSIEKPAFKLLKTLCGQYPFYTDEARAKIRKLIEALTLRTFSDREMLEMWVSALEDARVGRGEAEVENLHRDVLAQNGGA